MTENDMLENTVNENTVSPEAVNAANAAASTGNISDDGQGAAFFTAAETTPSPLETERRRYY